MNSSSQLLGTLKPKGGGDPIPLKRQQLVIGRRPSCDIHLDYANISGKHCTLSYLNGVWHIRDMGSSNGTMINGIKIASQQGIMPTDTISFANHEFQLDYTPAGPISFRESRELLGDNFEEGSIGELKERRSLLELAGLSGRSDGDSGSNSTRRAPNLEPRSLEFDDDSSITGTPAPNKVRHKPGLKPRSQNLSASQSSGSDISPRHREEAEELPNDTVFPNERNTDVLSTPNQPSTAPQAIEEDSDFFRCIEEDINDDDR